MAERSVTVYIVLADSWTVLRIDAREARTGDPPAGMTVTDDEWALDVDEHRAFLEAVTGTRLPPDPDAADCYRVGNRLEGFIEEHAGDPWPPTPEAAAATVDDWSDVHWLADFFRACHDHCRSPDPAPMR